MFFSSFLFHGTTWEEFYDVSLWLITHSWRDVRLSETDNADFNPSAFSRKTRHQSSVSRPSHAKMKTFGSCRNRDEHVSQGRIREPPAVRFHHRAASAVNDLAVDCCWHWRGITGRTVSFSLCAEALLDPGPANLIPMLVNIYQQQARHAMPQPTSLKRGNAHRERMAGWVGGNSVTWAFAD